MTTVLGFLVLGLALMVQMVVSRSLNLINGSADIIMLVIIAWFLQKKSTNSWDWALIGGFMVGSVSALPLYIPIISYLVVAGFAKILQNRIWQTPILAMFLISSLGSIIYQLFSVLVLQISGVPLKWDTSIQMVILPSALLNLLLALPIYALVSDFTGWLFPHEAEA
jgi:hypothetical protein